MRTKRISIGGNLKSIRFIWLLSIFLTACGVIEAPVSATSTSIPAATPAATAQAADCPVTEATWAKPPEDSAVLDPPAYSYYFVNEDRSIWSSAAWTSNGESFLRAGEEGNKVGWFRPAGASLEITGERIDGQAPPMQAEVPCCYPTRFQATGLIFPAAGCWRITAQGS